MTTDSLSLLKKAPFSEDQIAHFTELTHQFLTATHLAELESLVEEHEALLSNHLQLPRVQEVLFSTCPGKVKSLGGWGGDFVLLTQFRESQSWLENHGFDIEWQKEVITERFVYLWADGVHVKVRLGEDKKLCLLVIIGVTESGEKKLLAVSSGYGESEQSWTSIFNDLERRGLMPPMCLIGDGALGPWAAASKMEFLKKL